MQVDALEHNRLTGGELLSRIHLLEGRMDAVAAAAGLGGDNNFNLRGPGLFQPGSSSSSVPAAAGIGLSGATSSSSDTANSNSSCMPGNPSSGDSKLEKPGSSSAAVGGLASTPFTQAKLVRQVAALEQQAAVLQESSVQLTFKTEQVRPVFQPVLDYGSVATLSTPMYNVRAKCCASCVIHHQSIL
jgi:hypothetical protein